MKKQKGFTIRELLIASSIIAILGLIAFGVTFFVLTVFFQEPEYDVDQPKTSILSYVQTVRSDLTSLSEPYCSGRSNVFFEYVSCSVSGINPEGVREVVKAECYAGPKLDPNKGCE